MAHHNNTNSCEAARHCLIIMIACSHILDSQIKIIKHSAVNASYSNVTVGRSTVFYFSSLMLIIYMMCR